MFKSRNSSTAALALLTVFLFGCGQNASESPGNTGSVTPAEPSVVPVTNMVLIKAGSFIRQNQRVTLSRDFWLGKFEVTQVEFSSLMSRNPSHFQGATNTPVEKLSARDAAAYCTALTERERQAGRLPQGYTYRLPTEAEWEYACRAGTTNFFSFGDHQSEADKYAWTAENSDDQPHPVGLKLPNPWGLHDMHGNVWEWVSDFYVPGPFPEADLIDPTGPPRGKFGVFRGGGWNQNADFARSANRFMMSPSNGIHFVGFRVALGAVAPPR